MYSCENDDDYGCPLSWDTVSWWLRVVILLINFLDLLVHQVPLSLHQPSSSSAHWKELDVSHAWWLLVAFMGESTELCSTYHIMLHFTFQSTLALCSVLQLFSKYANTGNGTSATDIAFLKLHHNRQRTLDKTRVNFCAIMTHSLVKAAQKSCFFLE